MRCIRGLVTVICTIWLIWMGSPTASAAPISGTTMNLSPTFGPPSTVIALRGTGFVAGEAIALTFDATVAASTTASGTGTFAAHVRVPGSALPGPHAVAATGQASKRSVSRSFLVRTNWTEAGFNATSARFNPYENVVSPANVANLTLDWSYATISGVEDQPAIVNGMVYVGANDGTFYAFDAASGALRWSAATGNSITAAPAVAGKLVYVNSTDGFLYAFKAAGCGSNTCGPVWKINTGNTGSGSPLVVSGIVYVAGGNQELYALNATTGTTVWAYQDGTSLGDTLSVVGGVVYLGGYLKVYALKASTGALLWAGNIGDVASGVAMASGIIYVTSQDDNLYAFKASGCGAATCNALWKAPTQLWIYSSPAVANGVVYVGGYDGYVYAFSAAGCGTATCAPLWTGAVNAGIVASPAVANGVVYAATRYGTLYAFNAAGCGSATCAALGSEQVGVTIGGAPAIANGVIYVGTWNHGNTTAEGFYAYHLPGDYSVGRLRVRVHWSGRT